MRRLLSVDEVKAIRLLARDNVPFNVIQDSYPDVPYNTIYRAAVGLTYIDIKEPPPVGVPWNIAKWLPLEESKTIKDLTGRCHRCEILCSDKYCSWCLEEEPSLTESVQMS